MKINRIILEFEKWLAILLLAFMITITFAQVIARYFFNTGWAWVPEMVVFGLVSVTLVGASTGVKSGVHIGVDVIVKLFPPRYQRWSTIFADCSGLLLYLFMSYLTLRFVLYLKEMGQHSIITGFPIWLMVVYMPFAFFFMGLHYAESLWTIHKRKEKDMSQFETKRI